MATTNASSLRSALHALGFTTITTTLHARLLWPGHPEALRVDVAPHGPQAVAVTVYRPLPLESVPEALEWLQANVWPAGDRYTARTRKAAPLPNDDHTAGAVILGGEAVALIGKWMAQEIEWQLRAFGALLVGAILQDLDTPGTTPHPLAQPTASCRTRRIGIMSCDKSRDARHNVPHGETGPAGTPHSFV
ncbi:MAG: hypothetical protein IPL36_05390 [Nigerium sp.]|nr:hypothetical protein [Nigerium sp.]